ncbi:hypothetical protein CSKR_106031, partial [Clonorchis sinensis]
LQQTYGYYQPAQTAQQAVGAFPPSLPQQRQTQSQAIYDPNTGKYYVPVAQLPPQHHQQPEPRVPTQQMAYGQPMPIPHQQPSSFPMISHVVQLTRPPVQAMQKTAHRSTVEQASLPHTVTSQNIQHLQPQ